MSDEFADFEFMTGAKLSLKDIVGDLLAMFLTLMLSLLRDALNIYSIDNTVFFL